jgi:signal transduction histidine kinase
VDLLGSEVHRFQQMVVDLLEISRDDQIDDDRALETLDLAELVRNVLAGRPGDPPQVEIDRPALVVGDRRRMDRVVANLLDNADCYGGGAVRIAVSRRHRWTAGRAVPSRPPGSPAPAPARARVPARTRR